MPDEEKKEITLSQLGDMISEKLAAHKEEIKEEIKTEVPKAVDEELEKGVEVPKNNGVPVEVGDPGFVRDPKMEFKAMWEFAGAVAKADKDPRNVDPRLLNIEKVQKELTGLVSEDGAYAIPRDFSTAAVNVVAEVNPFLGRVTNIPMSTTSIDFPYIDGFNQSGGLIGGGVEWKWLQEGDQISDTSPKLGEFSMKLNELAALCYTTRQILDDSPISMEGLLNQAFSSGLNFQLNKVFMAGTGVGQPLGITNLDAVVSVAKESAQAADTIVFENIIKMYQHVYDDDGGKAGLVFFANKDTFAELAGMEKAVGTGGGPVWLPSNSIAGKPYDTLMGIPLIFFKHCETLGDAGDIMLANLSQYWVATPAGSAGPDFASSMHLKFDYNKMAFRWLFRVDGKSPWPKSFTGPNSKDKLSPFITLAARA